MQKEIADLIMGKYIENLENKKINILEKMTFSQKLKIAEALYWNKINEWVWGCARKLNSLRNDLSHELIPDNFEKDLSEFMIMVEKGFTSLKGQAMAHGVLSD